MPSRMETFGIVAVEAFAAATPVVAFASRRCARSSPTGAGFAVPPFDVEAYAQRLARGVHGRRPGAGDGRRGPPFAAGYDWDVLAAQQAEVYRAAAVEVAAR